MTSPRDDFLRSRPVVMRLLVRSREYRHPTVWVRVRVASGIWNLGLGAVMLASVHWLGPFALVGLVPLAGSWLLFWTARQLQRTASS